MNESSSTGTNTGLDELDWMHWTAWTTGSTYVLIDKGPSGNL